MPVMRRLAFAGLILFVASIPSENAIVFGGWGTLNKGVGLVTLFIGLFALARPGQLLLRAPSIFLLSAGIFVFWGITSYFWSVNPAFTLSRSTTYVQLLAMSWLIWELARTRWHCAILMQAFVVGCYVLLGLAFATLLSSSGGFREVGPGFNPNGFSVVLALALPMAWYLAHFWKSKALYWVNLLYIPLMMFGVLMAASRGGMVTTLAALTVIPLTLPHISLSKRLVVLLMLIGGSSVVLFYLPTAYPELQRNVERLAETGEQIRGGSLSERRTIWAAGWEVFKNAPVVGVGLDGFRYAVEPIYGAKAAPHNAFLSILVSLGLVGAIWFLLIFVSVMVPILLTRAEGQVFHLILLMTLFVGLMPTNGEIDKFTWFVLAVLASQYPMYFDLARQERGQLLPAANHALAPIRRKLD